MTAETSQLGDRYREAFHAFERSSVSRQIPWLARLRSEALDRFCAAGFPTTHDEDWRFTDVSKLAGTEFLLASNGRTLPLQRDAHAARPISAVCILTFVNGSFAREMSSLEGLPSGLTVSTLGQQFQQDPSQLEPYLGRYLDTHRDPFCALNTAFLQDGVWLHAAKGLVVKDPVYLRFMSTASGQPAMSHSRNLIVAEPGSAITLVEEHVSAENDQCLRTAATELIAKDDSKVSHFMLDRVGAGTYLFSTLRVHQGRNSRIALHSLMMGGTIARNNVHPVLAGEGGECLINGLFVGAAHQLLDNYMLVEHAKPHCSSRQFYNGILDDYAHGVFHGRIIVRPDAQKTDAKQTNRNLLLSDTAQMDSKPQLEIFADDVKCTHGATIGQIEEDSLFYMRSRGIDEKSAHNLLLLAFAGECLERMEEGPVRDYVDRIVRERILRATGLDSKHFRAAGELLKQREEVAR